MKILAILYRERSVEPKIATRPTSASMLIWLIKRGPDTLRPRFYIAIFFEENNGSDLDNTSLFVLLK